MITDFDTGEHNFLSNFYKSPFRLPWYHADPGSDHIEWPTVEHYFAAAKTGDRRLMEKISGESYPGNAKRIGREVLLHPRWEAIKYDVMLRGLRQKFSWRGLAEPLAATGYLRLVEGNGHGDRVWGATWTDDPTLAPGEIRWAVRESDYHASFYLCGQNWLGRLLELVREETRAALAVSADVAGNITVAS